MKNWQIIGFYTILIIGFLLMSGCTGTGPTSASPVGASTPTPQRVIVTVTPTDIPTVTMSNYKVGDIVLHDTSNFHQGDTFIVILGVDSVHRTYTYDYIFRDAGSTQWYRTRTDTEIISMDGLEKRVQHGFKVDQIDISKIILKY